ncbi:MAG: hypothetical protein MJZ73_02205 [Bacteroidaceae bacterium]|nr:hypothetical protein [Bacteroidaceae bacterium]
MKYLFLIFAFIALISCSEDGLDMATREVYTKPWVNLEEMGIPFAEDIYIYPSYPGAEDWLSLSAEEQWAVCTISEGMLSDMSTAGLIQSFVSNPIIQGVTSFNNTSEYAGFQLGIKRFESLFEEISHREDAGELAAEYYLGLNKKDVSSKCFVTTLLEFLLAEESVYANLSSQSIRKIVKGIVNDEIDGEGQGTSFLLAKMLIAAQYEPFIHEIESNSRLSAFCAEQEKIPGEVFDLIEKHAKNYLKG